MITAHTKAVKALESDGMANTCELPLNVVKTHKPKVLTGLNQHARKRASYQRGDPPTFYGNESMLNVSLAPERQARTRV